MKTVTGLFDNYQDAEAAVRDLEDAGIPSDDISVVSRDSDYQDETSAAGEGASAGAGIGAIAGGTGGLLAGLGMLAIPGVGPVVAAGWLAATAAGAAAGAAIGGAAGGIVGALTSAGVSEDEAHVYAEGIRRGGTLVTVRTEERRIPDVEAILDRNRWVNVTERRRAYADEGWERFDESQRPYSADEIYKERLRYQTLGMR
ncbi:general stress protein [Rhizobiaceae bacterium n13]|uniref:General stress protein n=1 Tax=Ferirhizobium litorale TaxID=2927786 RepID=A0AAE3QBQ6_9HYPH|nr:general stress protein [Fererhizobium litorale]MDI7865220.1 general stress protein [Fererhizobium litorale]MDI7922832.1 general stress protein [Fererhizobium litorale]